ncbi:MAG: methylated-DNA-protein-cysteine methyltransferase-like protein [Cyclobacteriaceae bacterium]|jgi:methylated-DNA-protein-cysteine methyltransferase-like protein
MAKDHSNFFNDVYEVVKLIPKGKVTSYGAIGEYLGLKSSARMVGWAMNAAHGLPVVPAHRVVNRNGLLTGKYHFATPTIMQELLEAEGVKVVNDKITNFKSVYWEPMKELL